MISRVDYLNRLKSTFDEIYLSLHIPFRGHSIRKISQKTLILALVANCSLLHPAKLSANAICGHIMRGPSVVYPFYRTDQKGFIDNSKKQNCEKVHVD